MNYRPLVVIPCRMGATRLPGKPLADIAGQPMIWHVWHQLSTLSGIDLIVACDDQRIIDALPPQATCVLTTECHAGTDRVAQAVALFDPDKKHDVVINVQGDMPLLYAPAVLMLANLFKNPSIQMGTVLAPLVDGELELKSVVKAECSQRDGAFFCHDFWRQPQDFPADHQLFHHIGIYGLRRELLDQYVTWPAAEREKERSLEQLRALDKGVEIWGVFVEEGSFLSVDTPADLILANHRVSPLRQAI